MADREQVHGTHKYREHCGRILGLSPNIRYVGIMNEFGRTLGGQLRRDVKPLFAPDEARNENFIEATRTRLRKNFDRSIGRTEFTFTQNEKVKIVVLPAEGSFYYITLDKNTELIELEKIIASIRNLIISDKIK
jgi:hypothetical protein